MRRALLGSGLVLAIAACGGKVVSDGTTSGASGTTAPTSTITFPSPGNDTPPGPTSGPAPPKPPAPDGASYSAQAWPGGLDHVDIFKADRGRDLCVHMSLAYPGSDPGTGPFGGIKSPPGWSVQSVDKSSGAKDCDFRSRGGDPVQAKEAHGFVSWPATSGKLYPCWLDVDVTITFPDGTTETMSRDAVNVIGGC